MPLWRRAWHAARHGRAGRWKKQTKEGVLRRKARGPGSQGSRRGRAKQPASGTTAPSTSECVAGSATHMISDLTSSQGVARLFEASQPPIALPHGIFVGV